MATITARKLSRDTASVIDELVAKGEPVLIVRRGKPVAVLSAVDPARIEDVVLSTAPELAQALARANEAAGTGDTETFEEIFGDEQGGDGERGDEERRLLAGGYELPLDPVLLDDLAVMVVGGAPLGADETPGGVTPERLQQMREVSLRLARRLLADSIDQTMQLVNVLSVSMIGAGESAGTAKGDRFDRMLAMLGEGTAPVPSRHAERSRARSGL